MVSVAAHVRPARNMQAACTPDRRLAADSGVVSAYLHAGPAAALGRMGALLALEASGAAQAALSRLQSLETQHCSDVHPSYSSEDEWLGSWKPATASSKHASAIPGIVDRVPACSHRRGP